MDRKNKRPEIVHKVEINARPFDDVKVIYDQIGKGLKPLGLRLDYERIKRTRPKIAEMLR